LQLIHASRVLLWYINVNISIITKNEHQLRCVYCLVDREGNTFGFQV